MILKTTPTIRKPLIDCCDQSRTPYSLSTFHRHFTNTTQRRHPLTRYTALMFQEPVGRLRAIGFVEAISYLLLLGIAMPLKYAAGRPEAVLVVGWAHGILFLAFCLALALARTQARLPWPLVMLAFLASLLPFGPFFIDERLRNHQAPAD